MLGLTGFELSFQLSEAFTLSAALYLAWRDAAARPGFTFAALATLAQMTCLAALDGAVWWEKLVVRLLDVPAAPMAIVTGCVALALLRWAWRRVPARAAPVAT